MVLKEEPQLGRFVECTVSLEGLCVVTCICNEAIVELLVMLNREIRRTVQALMQKVPVLPKLLHGELFRVNLLRSKISLAKLWCSYFAVLLVGPEIFAKSNKRIIVRIST